METKEISLKSAEEKAIWTEFQGRNCGSRINVLGGPGTDSGRSEIPTKGIEGGGFWGLYWAKYIGCTYMAYRNYLRLLYNQYF